MFDFAGGNPYMFTGRRFDSETGLYYYRARYYSPDIGRFLQPDPIGYYGGLNLYTYVGNNPVNNVDPAGLAPYSYMFDPVSMFEPSPGDECCKTYGGFIVDEYYGGNLLACIRGETIFGPAATAVVSGSGTIGGLVVMKAQLGIYLITTFQTMLRCCRIRIRLSLKIIAC